MKIWFDLKKKSLCAAIDTADTPYLRKLLLTNFFTKHQCQKCSSRKTHQKSWNTGIAASHRKYSFSKLNKKVGQNRKKHDSNFGKLRQHEEKSVRLTKVSLFLQSSIINVTRNAPEKFNYRYYCITMKTLDYISKLDSPEKYDN